MRRRSSQPREWGFLLPLQDGFPHFELRQGEASLGPGRSCDLRVEKVAEAPGAAARAVLLRLRRALDTGRVVLRSESAAVRVNGRAVGRGRDEPLQHGARIAFGGVIYIFVDRAVSDSFKAPSDVVEKYLIGQRLGEGGFGQVYLLFDKKSNYEKKRAMKVVETSAEQDRIFAKREADILQNVNHPCVIQTYNVIRQGQQQFLIMEFLAGGDLSQFVNDKRPLTEAQTKLLFFQLALAVRYLHEKNICHRDLKPANILLQRRDPKTLIKVTDFGLAKDGYAHSALTTVAGTELYLAPEVMSDHAYTKQVDIWSMGVMLFYSLSGYLPFHGMSEAIRLRHQIMYHPKQWTNLSVASLDLVKRMLKVPAEQRPSADQIVESQWMQDEAMREDAYQLTGLEVVRLPPKSPAPGMAAPTAAAAAVAAAAARRKPDGPRGVLEYYPKGGATPPPVTPAHAAPAKATPGAPGQNRLFRQWSPAAKPTPVPVRVAAGASPRHAPAAAAPAPTPPQRNPANLRRRTSPARVQSPTRLPAAASPIAAQAAARANALRAGATPVAGAMAAANGLSPTPPPANTPQHRRAQKTFLMDARRQLKPVERTQQS